MNQTQGMTYATPHPMQVTAAPAGYSDSPAEQMSAATPQAAPAARSMALVQIVSAIAGATMTRLLNNKGDVHWELDQLKEGLKHVYDDKANEGTGVYETSTLTIKGPHGWSTVFKDQIYADFELRWQYNGRSLGNIQITPVRTNDAVLMGLTVKAQIMDEENAFTRPPSTERFAAIHVQFHYHFEHSVRSDMIAITDLVLYGDGNIDQRFRWTQK